MTGAAAINSDVQELVTLVKGTISDIQNSGRFNTISGTTILSDIQLQVATLLATLGAFESQLPSWEALQGGQALMLSDLQSLNTAFTDFLNAVIAAESLALKPGALAVKAEVTGAFTSAIAIYSL